MLLRLAGRPTPPVWRWPQAERYDLRHSRARQCDREQQLRGRNLAVPAKPAKHHRSKTLPNGDGDHVIAEHMFAADRPRAAHRDHLVCGHAEHLAKAQQHRKCQQAECRRWPQPKTGAGQQHQECAAPCRNAVMATVNEPADPHSQRRPESTSEKPAAITPIQTYRKIKLDGPIGRRDTRQGDTTAVTVMVLAPSAP